jgi:hypothetical protein
MEMHIGNALAKFNEPLNKLLGGIANGTIATQFVS